MFFGIPYEKYILTWYDSKNISTNYQKISKTWSQTPRANYSQTAPLNKLELKVKKTHFWALIYIVVFSKFRTHLLQTKMLVGTFHGTSLL